METEKPKTLYDLYLTWTEEEKTQALIGMKEYRRVELASALRSAGYSASALRSAGYSASALRSAGYSASALRSAGYSASEVLSAGYSASGKPLENPAEKDIKAKATLMGRQESNYVIETLRKGLMNGSDYGTSKSCGCLLGTAAKCAGLTVEDYCKSRGIKKDSGSPAEEWFMGVGVGDTPENNFAAEMGVKWISEAIANL